LPPIFRNRRDARPILSFTVPSVPSFEITDSQIERSSFQF
jgi:hypothetical protein